MTQWKLSKDGNGFTIQSASTRGFLAANGNPGTSAIKLQAAPFHWNIRLDAASHSHYWYVLWRRKLYNAMIIF